MPCFERVMMGVAYCAKMAWKLEVGRHIIDGCAVYRYPKLVVVREEDNHPFFRIVAFPQVKHFEMFDNKVALFRLHTKIGGHQIANPKAIGTIALEDLTTDTERGQALKLHYASMHFHVGREEWMLPRSLASYYGGWRVRCLEESIRLAFEREQDLIITRGRIPEQLSGFRAEKKSPFVLDIEKAATNLGASVSDEEHLIRIIPPEVLLDVQ